MTLSRLLLALHEAGIGLRAKPGGGIGYAAPPGALSDALRRDIAYHRTNLVDLVHGLLPDRPSVLELATRWRRTHGDGFREAFIGLTACDFWETTPDWIDLYTFTAWLEAGTPFPGGSDGLAPDSGRRNPTSGILAKRCGDEGAVR